MPAKRKPPASKTSSSSRSKANPARARSTTKKLAPTGGAVRKRAASPKKPAAARSRGGRKRTPQSYGLGPHEAIYSGVEFRSQLEARWAVFFDVLGWDWDYEPCHYPLGPNLGYLPDFYLPRLGLWVEGKGPTFLDAASMGKIINGTAGPQPLPLRDPPYWPNNGILLLGPMQPLVEATVPVHTWMRGVPDAPTAQAWSARITSDGLETVGTKPFATYPADGTKPVRRPTAVRTVQLLQPSPAPGFPVDAAVQAAYQVALAVRFDGPKVTLPAHPFARHLNDRRRGRPYRAGGVVQGVA